MAPWLPSCACMPRCPRWRVAAVGIMVAVRPPPKLLAGAAAVGHRYRHTKSVSGAAHSTPVWASSPGSSSSSSVWLVVCGLVARLLVPGRGRAGHAQAWAALQQLGVAGVADLVDGVCTHAASLAAKLQQASVKDRHHQTPSVHTAPKCGGSSVPRAARCRAAHENDFAATVKRC